MLTEIQPHPSRLGELKDEQTRREAEVEEEEEEKGERLLVVGVYTLATIALCLTALDVYLLAWIWSSCVELGLPRFWSIQAEPHWLIWSNYEKPETADKENKFSVRFSRKLSSNRTIQLARIRSANSASGIEVLAPNGFELDFIHTDKTLENLTGSQQFQILRNKNSDSTNLLNKTAQLLELQSTNARIQFPNGLLVGGGALWCPADSKEPDCQVHAERVSLSSVNSFNRVDANSKSIHTNRIQTNRMHSATQQLQLHSAHSTLLTGRSGMQLVGLEGITLASRHSKIRLSANRIELSDHVELKVGATSGQNLQRHYKLCICQREKTALEEDEKKLKDDDNKLGLVFAVRVQLKCESFNSFCRL